MDRLRPRGENSLTVNLRFKKAHHRPDTFEPPSKRLTLSERHKILAALRRHGWSDPSKIYNCLRGRHVNKVKWYMKTRLRAASNKKHGDSQLEAIHSWISICNNATHQPELNVSNRICSVLNNVAESLEDDGKRTYAEVYRFLRDLCLGIPPADLSVGGARIVVALMAYLGEALEVGDLTHEEAFLSSCRLSVNSDNSFVHLQEESGDDETNTNRTKSSSVNGSTSSSKDVFSDSILSRMQQCPYLNPLQVKLALQQHVAKIIHFHQSHNKLPLGVKSNTSSISGRNQAKHEECSDDERDSESDVSTISADSN